MKKFAAQYIFSGKGDIIKQGTVTCDENGVITDISANSGGMVETSSTPFYNGIIVPGFINCHCHLELSDMHKQINTGTGLGNFVKNIREKRNPDPANAVTAAHKADQEIYRTGTSAIADICNTSLTFDIKEHSQVEYINLIEVFGIDPDKSDKRISELKQLMTEASRYGSPSYPVPHSAYSLSRSLWESLGTIIKDNPVTSVHFMESKQEFDLLEKKVGGLADSYSAMGINKKALDKGLTRHLDIFDNYMPVKGRIILVHNTFADENTISRLTTKKNISWCICPRSNLYIENQLPPVDLLRKYNADIVIGTDSLASNTTLNMLDELIVLQENYPSLSLNEMIGWACFNGAKTLGKKHLGTIETGNKPGLVLLENCRLDNLSLTPDSRPIRLI